LAYVVVHHEQQHLVSMIVRRREDPDADFSNIKRFIPRAKQQKQKARLSRIIKIRCGKSQEIKQDYD